MNERINTVEDFDILKVMQAVASELGDGWQTTIHDERPRVTLSGPKGERIIPRANWGSAKPGQVNLYGSVGKLPGMGVSINVNVERGAATIARDITRRLLPVYHAALTEAQQAVDAEAKARVTRQAATRELADKLPNSRLVSQADDGEIRFHLGEGYKNGYGDVRINNAGTGVSEIKIRSIPLDAAIKLAAFLATLDS